MTTNGTQPDEITGTTCDVIVVGGGAAGLSGALTLGRAGRRTLVIDAGLPRNRFADHLHGYLSRDGLSPADLLRIGRAEVEGYGGTILAGTVVAATVNGEGTRVEVTLDGGTRLTSRRLLVTTGLRDELPPIEGLAERWGRDVLHCPYCHGHEVRDQPLGVIATNAQALHVAHLIRQWSDDIVFFLNGQDIVDAGQRRRLEARRVRIVEPEVRRLAIDPATDRLVGVETVDGTLVERAAVFAGGRMLAEDALLVAMGAAVERNEVASWVVTDRLGKTSIPGVWAAGNVTEPAGQVVHAAGGGTWAGAAINMSLVEEDFDLAVTASMPATAAAD